MANKAIVFDNTPAGKAEVQGLLSRLSGPKRSLYHENMAWLRAQLEPIYKEMGLKL